MLVCSYMYYILYHLWYSLIGVMILGQTMDVLEGPFPSLCECYGINCHCHKVITGKDFKVTAHDEANYN